MRVSNRCYVQMMYCDCNANDGNQEIIVIELWLNVHTWLLNTEYCMQLNASQLVRLINCQIIYAHLKFFKQTSNYWVRLC